ncbi:MAG: branched-chain amino acid ABC transporter permease [Deltaproteobacteria bacterium]|nr:MAG: branched-chain amino acid ABC transporter permease [Deltaproteobacteria bacterium]
MSAYIVTVSITTGIYVILAISLNIITGYAGQISLGHAAFFGIGAYASGMLATKLGVPFYLCLPFAVVVTGIVGAILGIPCLRVKDDFLAITTMGINFVVQAVFLYVPFFGGALGISNIPVPSFHGAEMTKSAYLIMVGLFVLFAVAVDGWLTRSWAGLALNAIREDETAAEMSGVNLTRFKVVAFVLGSAMAGLAGSLYAHFMSFVSATDFGFPESIVILSMVVFGGIGTLRGPVIGAIILGVAPELFRPILDYRTLLYGAMLVILMRFQPQGLLGIDSFIVRNVKRIFAREVT